LDFSNVPEEFRKYISDYRIHILDVCHTPDERLLEFPGDIATMFLTIKYREDLDSLENILQVIPEIEKVEADTYDATWNFLDKRMLKWKKQSEDGGGISMCGAVDQMLAKGREQGLSEGMEKKETSLILKMLKNNLPVEQIATITDKTIEEIQTIAKTQ